MLTDSYDTIRDLAAQFAGRTPGEIPSSENTLLQAFFAGELPDLWNKETWPELCANMEQVTVTANVFDKREGDANEMGEILGVYDADPRSVTAGYCALEWVEEDGQVRVFSELGLVYVDWQLPATNLTSLSTAALTATLLPRRFRLPLAYRGAALLLDNEDPPLANQYRRLADVEITRQASRMVRAWWRTPKMRVP